MKNTFKNHVYVVFDTSGSMDGIIDKAVEVFNNQIDYLREASLQFEQETRVSFYEFNSRVNCLISDVDVARPVKLDKVRATGSTSLIDAATLAIEDAKNQPQKYSDHSFLFYIITDGGENTSSRTNIQNFGPLLRNLPDNFTVTALVPDNNGVMSMKNFGVPAGNIDKWEATKRGVEEVGQKMQATMNNFFQGREKGVKSYKTMFSDLKEVNKDNVNTVLSEIPKKQTVVVINEEVKAVEIRPLVESKTNVVYTKGCAFYELIKTEHIQSQKEIIVQNKKNGKFYGGKNARSLLNLPDQEVKMVPTDFGEWIVYVQSTSVNRKVIPKQRVLVIK